jgi:hypothetical protein
MELLIFLNKGYVSGVDYPKIKNKILKDFLTEPSSIIGISITALLCVILGIT